MSFNTLVRKYSWSARGFTLLEILVVIGIIAILASIVIVAINPARQFAQARNTERVSNVNAILNAIGQRLADNAGVFDGGTPACPTLAAGTVYSINSSSGAGDVDLSCLTPTYIPTALPFDPTASGAHWKSASDYDTGYTVSVDANGRYTIAAPAAELSTTVAVTR